jgi:hypothetical protein
MLPVDREVKTKIPVRGIEAKFEVAANLSGLETRQAARELHDLVLLQHRIQKNITKGVATAGSLGGGFTN